MITTYAIMRAFGYFVSIDLHNIQQSGKVLRNEINDARINSILRKKKCLEKLTLLKIMQFIKNNKWVKLYYSN